MPRGGDVGELAPGVRGLAAEQLEGLVLGDAVALHQDALGALDRSAAAEGALEVAEGGEALEDDLDRALELVGVVVGDVGEDAAPGRPGDEGGIGGVEDGDDRAGGLGDDPLDQLERVVAALAEADERDVAAVLAGQAADAGGVGLAGDDLMAEDLHDRLELLEPFGVLVGDQELERLSLLLPRLLGLVAEKLLHLIGARIVTVWLPAPDGSLRLEASAGQWPRNDVDLRLAGRDQKLGRVLARGQTERVDSLLDDPEATQRIARSLGATTALFAPLPVRGRTAGIIACYDKLAAGRRTGLAAASRRAAEPEAGLADY